MRLLSELGSSPFKHAAGEVRHLAWTQDDQVLWTFHGRGEAIAWGPGGDVITRFRTPAPISHVLVTGDLAVLVKRSWNRADAELEAWNLVTLEQVWRATLPQVGTGGECVLSATDDASLTGVAVGGEAFLLRQGTLSAAPQGFVRLFPDGGWLGRDARGLFAAQLGGEARVVFEGSEGATLHALSNDVVAVAQARGRVTVWSRQGGAPRWSRQVSSHAVESLALRGRRLWASDGWSANWLDLTTGEPTPITRPERMSFVATDAVSSNGRWLARSVVESVISVFELPGFARVGPQPDHDRAVTDLAVSADGLRLISTDWDTVCEWELETRQRAGRVKSSGQAGITRARDGKWISFGSGGWFTEYVALEKTQVPFFVERTRGKPELMFSSHTWELTPDEQVAVVRAAATSEHRHGDFDVVGWNPVDRAARWVVGSAYASGLSVDGRTVAIAQGRQASGVVLVDAATGRQLPAKLPMLRASQVIARNDRRGFVALGDHAGAAGVFDVVDGVVHALPRGAEAAVESEGVVRIAPDGELVVAAHDRLILGWDLSMRALRFEHSLEGDAVSALRFAPDGRLLVGTVRGRVLLFDVGVTLATHACPTCSTVLRLPAGVEALRCRGCGATWSVPEWAPAPLLPSQRPTHALVEEQQRKRFEAFSALTKRAGVLPGVTYELLDELVTRGNVFELEASQTGPVYARVYADEAAAQRDRVRLLKRKLKVPDALSVLRELSGVEVGAAPGDLDLAYGLEALFDWFNVELARLGEPVRLYVLQSMGPHVVAAAVPGSARGEALEELAFEVSEAPLD